MPATAMNVYTNAFPRARNFLRSRLEQQAEHLEDLYAPARREAERRREAADARASRRAIRIVRSRVPTGLRPVIPLARKWGVGDDADREWLTRRMTSAERGALRKGLPAHVRREINAWLRTFTEGSMPAEAAAFMYLLEAYEEVL
jgi:hypothetical protein